MNYAAEKENRAADSGAYLPPKAPAANTAGAARRPKVRQEVLDALANMDKDVQPIVVNLNPDETRP